MPNTRKPAEELLDLPTEGPEGAIVQRTLDALYGKAERISRSMGGYMPIENAITMAATSLRLTYGSAINPDERSVTDTSDEPEARTT